MSFMFLNAELNLFPLGACLGLGAAFGGFDDLQAGVPPQIHVVRATSAHGWLYTQSWPHISSS